ncbi:aminotransferase, class-V [Pyrobaculum aerophilum str. IM2]|uniref:Aminotransferase, class-V n=2 Tax=Pyrobaculum aerophilum TaxID=13773 RepID=Q8ZT41_PYRAE|nr:alanine--glyoxylate aminotransferase family protein [Pyrobaculum aerophilum]AAL64922.1 aminotransferase, class-V [Pyrobaculum aerophilum str. IM2]HII46553.1 alanine--glyoxylate aminotransferase family protein [Pyrobaculum aerophilum]
MFKRFAQRRILTPGPTELPHGVKAALVRETTNPDLDPQFFQEYKQVIELLRPLLGAWQSRVYIWVGEAMLGLEAALANAVRPGTKVLVIDNGVYGSGFADLVKMYGGNPITPGLSWRRSADPSAIERILDKEKDVEVVTLVHCDTPSTVYNNLREIAKIVSSHGAYLIVDAVSSIAADEIRVDDWGVDVLIGGSQKALNAPPGLTILSISKRAWDRALEVARPSFYMNYQIWEEWLEKGGFPYTMSDVLIYALKESLQRIHNEGFESVFQRHKAARAAFRAGIEALGLEPYIERVDDTCPTATAFKTPLPSPELRRFIWEKYGVLFAGSWGPLEREIMRISHMGIQASADSIAASISILGAALRDLGFNVQVGKAVEVAIETFR